MKKILLSTTKIILWILTLTTLAVLFFCALPYTSTAYDLDPTLSLTFSGDTIRVLYFEDDTIDFAENLTERAIKNLFNGTPLAFHAQTLIFAEDNAVMNYNLDDPIEIITLAEIITQQIQNALDYQPDPLTFIIFNSALAVVYKYNLWTSDNYFDEAVKAIDRAEDDSEGGSYEITGEDYIFWTDGLNSGVYPKPKHW